LLLKYLYRARKVSGYLFASFNDSAIGYWNCSTSVVFACDLFYQRGICLWTVLPPWYLLVTCSTTVVFVCGLFYQRGICLWSVLPAWYLLCELFYQCGICLWTVLPPWYLLVNCSTSVVFVCGLFYQRGICLWSVLPSWYLLCELFYNRGICFNSSQTNTTVVEQFTNKYHGGRTVHKQIPRWYNSS
jgi:ABC-type microcin C transport system permease subunit YejE